MNTKQLKQKILSLAIRGQLVPQDPSDEPASELLKRIAAEKAANAPKGKKQKPTKDTSHYQQYPFELPQGWVWCKVEDISQSYIGLTYSPKDVSSQGTIVLRSSNIQNGKIDLTDIVRVSKEIPSKLVVNANDIIICARNGSKKLVGKSAIVPHIQESFTFGAFMAICKTPLFQYVHLFLLSDLFFSQLEDVTGTTTIYQLTQNRFNSFLLPLPPLKEQERIANEIGRLFTLIDQLEEDKESLQQLITQLKSKILSLAIRGQLVPQDANDEPAEALLKQIKPAYKSSGNLHYKNLPKGWEVIPVKMVCKLKDGEKKENVKLPYLDVKYFRGKTTDTIKENGKYIPKNTMLILVDGENSGEIFYALSEGYQGSTMKILEIDSIVDRAYILHFIASYQKELKENKVGSAIPHLNKKLFGELQLPLPPFVEQQRIVERVEKLFKQLDAIQNALAI